MIKPSLYNTILKLDDERSIIYNALSDTFIAFPTDQLTRKDDLSVSNPLLKYQFQKHGMLIDSNKDEINIVKASIREKDYDNSILYLHVNPTLACNFRCWYCYEDHRDTSPMTPNTIVAIDKNLKIRIKDTNPKHVKLYFFGGEPLLYFKEVAEKIINNTKTTCRALNIPFSIHFTSNAYLLNTYIIERLRGLDVSFQITLDGHRDSHNKVRSSKKNSSYDIILNNVKLLLSSSVQVILRINYTYENFQEIPRIIEDIEDFSPDEKELIMIDLQQVWQDIKLTDLSKMKRNVEAMLTQIQEKGLSASAPLHNDSINNACYADRKNHLLINHNGKIYFCTAREFNNENSVGELRSNGTISWNIKKVNQWYSCKFGNVTCQHCRIAPICGGGCRQKSLESIGLKECLKNYSEKDKDLIVMRRFAQKFINKK